MKSRFCINSTGGLVLAEKSFYWWKTDRPRQCWPNGRIIRWNRQSKVCPAHFTQASPMVIRHFQKQNLEGIWERFRRGHLFEKRFKAGSSKQHLYQQLFLQRRFFIKSLVTHRCTRKLKSTRSALQKALSVFIQFDWRYFLFATDGSLLTWGHRWT